VVTEDILRRAVHDAGLDAPVVYDEVTESTNATALALAERDTPEWTVVGAGHQTAGRGRLGRTWESRLGSSLLFSVVLRPRLSPSDSVILTLGAGAAASEAATEASGTVVRCKWPNDLVTEQGKVGGILLESRVSSGRLIHVVVGIGINLDRPPDVLEAAGLGPADAGLLVTRFLVRCHGLFERQNESIGELVLALYRPLCVTLGRTVRAHTTAGQTVMGVAEDLDGLGNLMVRTGETLETVAFGEVEHLRYDEPPAS
jgi:BirA family transcriptional regulator, biotin operon repressor / biotin---[acetyl-CoA-carboxylase] ligase